MTRLLREPLFHFVVLGALLFLLDGLREPRSRAPRDDEIVVSGGQIESMLAIFAKTWQRPPTETELRGLVEDHIREEALYREGLALGIDRDDVIIRRRVRQKMEFVVDDLVDLEDPTEDDLARWLAEHEEDYARPGRFRFRQVFLSPERRGDALEQDAATLLDRLRSEPDGAWTTGVGDPTLLEHAFADASASDVERDFGSAFTAALAEAPLGEWTGPVRSAFGVHLVRVDDRRPGHVPSLDDVRAEVERDWRHARREAAAERFYGELVGRYDVRVEWPAQLGIDEGSDG